MNEDWDVLSASASKFLLEGSLQNRMGYVKSYHLVFQPMDGVLVTIAKDLSTVPHYQVTLTELDTICPEKCIFYERKRQTKLLHVVHRLDSQSNDLLPWTTIANYLLKKPKEKWNRIEKQRQRCYADFGFTSGVCTT